VYSLFLGDFFSLNLLIVEKNQKKPLLLMWCKTKIEGCFSIIPTRGL